MSLGTPLQYKGLNGPPTDNEDEDYPPQFHLLHEQDKTRWSHIDDLDEFFTRVYQYHQNHGMPSLVFQEILNLFQILFLATFSIFMIECVDYKTLFESQKVVRDPANNTFVAKTHLTDVVFAPGACAARISFKFWVVLLVVAIFWLFRLVKAVYNISRYHEIRAFYQSALNLATGDLPNITWHEVQEKLLAMQMKYHLCVHKQELTELDIYNRILRFKNYQVAMVNQGILPPRFNLPGLGQCINLTSGFMYNFEFLFFWGPFAPFKDGYQLRPEFKVFSKRADLTAEISKSILMLGLFNLLLSPLIFVWQLLQFVYNHTELIKRDPSVLGSRKWSNYGRLYFRHFNELDHELDARLSRAYKPSLQYLESFVSKFLAVVAKFFVFTFGAVFAVLVVLTLWDEDVLNVEHVLTLISVSGAIAGIARSLIPDENAVYYMDQMMYQILAQVHYMPDLWKTHANSYVVRDEFVKLFQYRFVYLMEELLSPIVTPFLLLFWLRPKSARIVDFFRNFTVEIVGVGDVCSFSQMDTRRHGNPKWLSKTVTKRQNQARNGKTELSLIHFAHTNPNWKMPSESLAFLDQLRDQATRDSIEESQAPFAGLDDDTQGSLNKSLYHLQSLVYNSGTLPGNSYSANLIKSNVKSQQSQPGPSQVDLIQMSQASRSQGQLPRGAVNRTEGPLFASKPQTLLLSIAQQSALQLSGQTLHPVATPSITTALENSLDMCFSALYMHELHRKYHHGEYQDLDQLREENSDELNYQQHDNGEHDLDGSEMANMPLLGSASGSGGSSSNPNQGQVPTLQLQHEL